MYNQFVKGTKVFLDGEYGIIVDVKELFTTIRWDTPKEDDFEEWFSCLGTFKEMGGKIVSDDYQFIYIDNNGKLKD